MTFPEYEWAEDATVRSLIGAPEVIRRVVKNT